MAAAAVHARRTANRQTPVQAFLTIYGQGLTTSGQRPVGSRPALSKTCKFRPYLQHRDRGAAGSSIAQAFIAFHGLMTRWRESNGDCQLSRCPSPLKTAKRSMFRKRPAISFDCRFPALVPYRGKTKTIELRARSPEFEGLAGRSPGAPPSPGASPSGGGHRFDGAAPWRNRQRQGALRDASAHARCAAQPAQWSK